MENLGKRNVNSTNIGTNRSIADCFMGCNVMCTGLCNCSAISSTGYTVSDKDSSGMNAYYGRNYVSV